MSRRKRTFVILATGILVLGGSYFGVRYAEAKPYLDRQSTLDERLTKAASLGVPLSMQALRDRWPVAPEENAGELILRAIDEIDEVPKEVRQSPAELQVALDQGKHNDPEFRKRLAALDKPLDTAVEASARPKLDFGRNWDLGYKLDLGDLGDTKQLVRYLGVRAQTRAAAGNLASSLDDFRACYRIGTLLNQDPTTLAMTTQITTITIVDVAVQKALPQFAKDSRALTMLREIVRSERKVGDWSRALIGEAYLGVASIRAAQGWTDFAYMYSGDAGPTNPFSQIPKWIATDTVRNAFLSEYLSAVNEAFARELDPLALATAVEAMAMDLDNGKHPTTAIRSIMLPTFPIADDAFLKLDTIGHCLNALLDVCVFHAEKGRYPATLKEAGASELDPYKNGKLVYAVLPSKVLIYSFGRNGTDDGGLGRTGESGGSKDIVAWTAR